MGDRFKGKAENLKGRVKQAVGTITGDKGLEAEGLVDRVKGTVREKVGEAKRKIQNDDAEDEEIVVEEDED